MATADEVQADLDLFMTQVPTLEDQLFVSQICCYTYSAPARDITGPAWLTLATAPIPMRILSVTLSFEYWNLAASDTNYWRAELAVRVLSGASNIFATRTTQSTGANANGPIVARKAWTFDAAAWGPADLLAGESLMLRPSPTGSPASDWRLPMTATVRYRPL